jgi:hypothetical protein
MSLLGVFQRTQTPLTISLQTAPGPVGLMLGEKEFSPPTAFSVGETAGGDDGVDEGGVEGGVEGGDVALVAGASFSVVGLQPVMAPTAIRAAAAPTSRLRVNPPEVMRASRLLVGAAGGGLGPGEAGRNSMTHGNGSQAAPSGGGEALTLVRPVAERLLLRVAASAQIALAGLLHQRAVRGQNFDLPGYL